LSALQNANAVGLDVSMKSTETLAVSIVGVCGSLSENSHTRVLVGHVLEAARANGATTRLVDLRSQPLPMFEPGRDYSRDRAVRDMMATVCAADGFIVGSPEYHGCMSGPAKNFFDHLYHEIAGKLFGLVCATGGSQGTSCFDNMRAAVLYCHGWTLPYQVSASGADFDPDHRLVSEKVRERLRRMGRDIVAYAPLLLGQLKRDLAQPADAPKGFAHWTA
jgi:FMN reductase